MTAGLLASATLAAGALLIWLPLRWAFGLFVGLLVLVPDTMRFPYVSDQLVLVRVLPVVFLVGLLLRVGRGEVTGAAFRPSPAALGLIGFGVVAWVVGVMAADGSVPPTFSRDSWLLLPDQLIVLVTATATARTVGSVRAGLTVATVAVTTGAIAVLEALTGQGYAQLAFRHLPEQRQGFGGRLEQRSGQVRPRVATRFSLAYAWQATMLLPVAAAAAITSRRAWRVVGVGLLLVAIVLTSSRSAYLGVGAGMAGFALVSGRRSVVVAVAGLIVVAGLGVVASGVTDRAFQAPEAQGSSAIREERAPVVLDAAAADPFTGLGFGALLDRGLPGTDSSWLQMYAEIGAIGVTALALSIVMALAAVGPALTAGSPLSPARLVAAGCWAGIALSLLGAAYFDLFTGRQSVLVLWVLAAVGVAAAEEADARAVPPVQALGRRIWLPALGLVLGSVVLVAGPRPATVGAALQVLPVATDAVAGGPPTFVGRTLGHTACSVLTESAEQAGADTSCLLPVGGGVGAVQLRIASGSEQVTRSAAERSLQALTRRMPGTKILHLDLTPRSLPAPVRTAPLSGAAAGAALALLLPASTDRRRRRAVPTMPVPVP